MTKVLVSSFCFFLVSDIAFTNSKLSSSPNDFVPNAYKKRFLLTVRAAGEGTSLF